MFWWSSPTELDPDATATVVYDLGAETKLSAIRQRYAGAWIMPQFCRIRLGSGSPTVWTEVVPTRAVTGYENFDTFAATSARYVELSMIGTPAAFATSGGRGMVELAELFVYPSTAEVPALNTSQGYDLTYLNGVSATVNSNTYGWDWSLLDKAFTGVRGKTIAEGATGDSQATIDLGGLFQVSQVVLSFHLGAVWENGGKIELGVDGASPGTITWQQVYDTGLSVPFGAYPGIYPVTRQLARYVRVTNYFAAGTGPSLSQLDEIGVF